MRLLLKTGWFFRCGLWKLQVADCLRIKWFYSIARGLLAPGRPSGTFPTREKYPKARQPYGLDPLMITGDIIFRYESKDCPSAVVQWAYFCGVFYGDSWYLGF